MASVSGFAKILSQLAETADRYRKSAFLRAKASLGTVTSERITYEEAEKLPGFGSGILARFKEYQQTQKLEELKGVEEKIDALTVFEGIYGVGPVLAKKWFEQGYRKLSDIPLDKLTRVQQLGIQYYDQINERIPRAEIDQINTLLQTAVSRFNCQYRCQLQAQICGSYLRGKASSGDIDVILTDRKGKLAALVGQFMKESGLVSHILAQGSAKILTLGGIPNHRMRRIDFELVEPTDWPYALLYFTGSKNFNQHMRGIAKDQGMLLNHLGLFLEGGEGAKIEVSSEQEIFEFLNMKYLTPAERDKY